MKKLIKLLTITGIIVNGMFLNRAFSITPEQLDSVIDIATYQYQKMIDQVVDTTAYPRTIEDEALKTVNTADWTSGFFPGSLWYLYELTDDDYWKTNAAKWTHAIEEQTDIDWTHDLGFMFYCSFGNGYRLTGNTSYIDIMIDAANTLDGRFKEKVGITDSWGWGSWAGKTEAIIDNMMNLELLFWASMESGDSIYYERAKKHAETTMANHFRSDYSSYHLVQYDVFTGAVIRKQTVQGYSDESSWARGQGWGLYGYVMSYRETGDVSLLEQAEHIADYIIGRLPADFVPYWDFDDPAIPSAPRDASAAALYSSALFELSQYSDKGQTYYNKAVQILESLMSDNYLADKDQNKNFLLMHSTGHKPGGSEIDVPLNYADYYFLEALIRYKRLNGWKNVKPEFEEIANVKVYPGHTSEVPVSVIDDIIDFVDIDTMNTPDFAAVTNYGNRKGVVVLNPTAENLDNEYTITLVATDKFGEKDTTSFKVEVVNVIPEFQAISDVTTYAGGTYNISVLVDDEIEDTVNIEMVQVPDFASFAVKGVNQGTITLSPTSKDMGKEYTITLVATDKFDKKDTVSFKTEVFFNYIDNAVVYSNIADPKRTIDGNLISGWSGEGSNQEIIYDMTRIGTLSEVAIAFYKGDEEKTQFKLETSTDSASWTSIFDGKSSGTTDQLEIVYSGETSTRFVRFTGFGTETSEYTIVREITFDFVPDVLTGVKQNTLANSQLLAYPNPCSEELSLKLNNTSGDIQYAIYNISGEMVQTEIINHIGDTYVINVSDLKSGVYMYRLINNDKMYVGKFIKR